MARPRVRTHPPRRRASATAEEAEAIERLSRRIVGDPPKGTWKRELSGFRDVGPAFPRAPVGWSVIRRSFPLSP
jgi:hypothetical protein